MRKSVDDAGYDGLTSGERMRKQRGGSMREMYARNFGYMSGSPELSPTMTYGTGVDGDKGPTNVSVSGQVTGDGKLAIEPAPEICTGR
jgi:hypothetical protein